MSWTPKSTCGFGQVNPLASLSRVTLLSLGSLKEARNLANLFQLFGFLSGVFLWLSSSLPLLRSWKSPGLQIVPQTLRLPLSVLPLPLDWSPLRAGLQIVPQTLRARRSGELPSAWRGSHVTEAHLVLLRSGNVFATDPSMGGETEPQRVGRSVCGRISACRAWFYSPSVLGVSSAPLGHSLSRELAPLADVASEPSHC